MINIIPRLKIDPPNKPTPTPTPSTTASAPTPTPTPTPTPPATSTAQTPLRQQLSNATNTVNDNIVNPGGIPFQNIIARADPTSDKFRVRNSPNPNYSKYCDMYGEYSVLNHAGVYDGAVDWKDYAAAQKHLYPGSAPAGTVVFYDTGNENEHVVISAGGGYVWTTGQNGDPIKKVRADEVYNGAKPFGWTDIVQGERNGKPKYIQYDKTTAGKDFTLPNNSGTVGSSETTTAKDSAGSSTITEEKVKPVPTPTPTPTPTPGSSFSNPFGSIFGSIFGMNNTQNKTVAQGPSSISASSSITPGMSSQFDNYTPASTNESSTSGSSAETLANAEPNSDVTVKPVGS